MNEEIYHDPIIAWSKRREHMGTLEKADCRATGNNPLCGDRISVEIKMARNKIKAVVFNVRGCILARASAAHLAFHATGIELERFESLTRFFRNALTSADSGFQFPENHEIFRPVRSRKSRHSCILLPYDTVAQALGSLQDKEISF